MRALIVGAGPVGLEAALRLHEAGHDVTVVESGYNVGAAVRSWSHVRLFSPWRLNVSEAGLSALATMGVPAPDPEVFPTGEQFCDAYLDAIAEYLFDRVTFLFDTDVVAIGRGRVFKTQHIGDGGRDTLPFRALIEGESGERVLVSDVVLDCSGVLDQPNFVGVGGIPALGEAELDERIVRRIPDLDRDREDFAGRTTLVVGGGTSAATTLRILLDLRELEPATRILWATATDAQPFERIDDDPLPQRDALAELGNAIAAGGHDVAWLGGFQVERLGRTDDDRLRVVLTDAGGQSRVEVVDQLVANVGYRPNTALFEELQVHQCYATQGTMKLAASLLAAGGGSGDCLAQDAPGPGLLENPEPGFFVLGAKSYGRNSAFLMRVGYEQVDAVMGLIGG